MRNITDVYLDFFHHHWIHNYEVSKTNCFRLQVNYLKTKALCFWNVLFVYSVMMEKVQIYISDISQKFYSKGKIVPVYVFKAYRGLDL